MRSEPCVCCAGQLDQLELGSSPCPTRAGGVMQHFTDEVQTSHTYHVTCAGSKQGWVQPCRRQASAQSARAKVSSSTLSDGFTT